MSTDSEGHHDSGGQASTQTDRGRGVSRERVYSPTAGDENEREKLREILHSVEDHHRKVASTRPSLPSETVADRKRKRRLRQHRDGETETDRRERIENLVEQRLEEYREEHPPPTEEELEEEVERVEQLFSDNQLFHDGYAWRSVQSFLRSEHDRAEEQWGRMGVESQTRVTPDSAEFLRETQGDIPDPLHVDIDRFLALPRRVVEDLIEFSAGGLTWGDSVRMEIPALSYIAGLAVEQPDGERTIEYDHGDTVSVPEGQVVISKQKVARALYERFYFYPTHREDIDSDDSFKSFYRTVARSIDRLIDTPSLDHHGPAIKTGDKKSDAFGQRYSVHIPNLHSLPLARRARRVEFADSGPRSPADFYVDTFTVEGPEGREIVDVASMFDRLVIEHTGQWETFTEQAAKSTTASEDPSESFRTSERGVDGFQWQRRQARPSTVDRDDGKENSRHLTTGAFKPEHATSDDRSHLPCTIPFVVLEVDGETPQLTLEYARRIVRWLDSMDVPLDSITVTYTGNESFHVRLPAGLFGKPIFRSAREATRIVREFYDLIEEQIDRLGGAYVDGALASPLHHIRAIGSVHEGLYSKKDRTRYCVGFTADEILKYPLNAIREFSERYDGYTLPEPGKAPFHQKLHDLLLKAHRRTQQSPESGEGDDYGSDGIIERVRREGVEKGEEFGPDLVGRNLAARLMTLHFLQSGRSTQDAWVDLQDWNEKNSPPLGEAPDDYAGELRYVFEKAEEDAPYL